MHAGPEAEFFLFQSRNGRPTTESHDAASYFDLSPVDQGEDVRREIVLALEAMGVHVDAAHHEIDFHARVRGLVERSDHVRVDQAVHLGEDTRRPAGPGRGRLALDERHDASGQVERGDEQVAELRRREVPGQHVEEQPHVGGDLRVGGEQREVGVDARGLGVVVAGAQVGVAAQHAMLLADDQAGLTVGLEAVEAVHDVRPGLLELAGPFDVVEFVEARPQFDERGDLLAVTCGFLERLDDRRVAAGAVERELDGDHVLIPGGLPEEINHRGEGFVGVVEQDVLLRNPGEEPRWLDAVDRQGRREGRVK